MSAVEQTRKSRDGRWLRAALLLSLLGGSAMRALLESLRRSTRAIPAREQAEAVQMGQDGTYTMGKNTFERLDELSQENRQKLREQIKRVQAEAKQLRAQARHLNRARHAEAKKRKKLMEQLARSGHTLKSSMWQRGEDAASQLKESQQAMLERQNRMADTLSQYGDQARQNLSGWRDGATQLFGNWREGASHSLDDWRAGASQKMAGLRGQGVQMSHNGRGNGATEALRKQKRQLGYNASDWRDDTTHMLRRQGQHVMQNMADWKDEAAYQLHRQKQQLARNIADRREDAMHSVSKQRRNMGRNMLERREDMTYQLRKQGRSLGRNLDERKGGIWPLLGFLFGVLLAGGITYWFIKNSTRQHEITEEEQIELQEREMLNGASSRPGGEIRYTSQGGTAVATRTSATPINKFVGVLSTRQYYPIERKPQVHDLVFFETEDDARAEGFTEAD